MKNKDKKLYKFNISKIHGYIKNGTFEVMLSKNSIEQFNNLNTKEEKVYFLETAGEIKITDFSIEEFDLDIDKNSKL